MKHQNIVDADLEAMIQLATAKLGETLGRAFKTPTVWQSEWDQHYDRLWNARFDLDGVPCTVRFDWEPGNSDPDATTETADEIVETINRIWKQHDELKDFLAEIRAAAQRHVRNAVRRNEPWKLLKVEPDGVKAGTYEFPAALVVIEMLGEALTTETHWFQCDDEKELGRDIGKLRETQKDRADLKAVLDKVGATAIIDSAVFEAMKRTGEDIGEILRKLSKQPHVHHATADGRRCMFTLQDSRVTGRVQLADDVFWDRGVVKIKRTPASMRKRHVEGWPICYIVESNLLDPRTMVQSVLVQSDEIAFFCQRPHFLFDEVSGTVKDEFYS